MFSIPRLKGLAFFLIATVFVLLPGRAEAQGPLADTFWQEIIALEVQTIGVDSDNFTGSNPLAPEPHTLELSGTGYTVSGSVGFGSSGPPVGTARVSWDISEAGAALDLRSSLSIDFQIKVVETATPPVSVTEVPVHLVATGSVAVEEIFGSRATSFFRFQAIGTDILLSQNLDIYGDPQRPDPPTDAFTIDETPLIPVDLVVFVGMSATASMGTVGTGGAATGTATGVVDPIIEIPDDTIPGTASSYRDFFAIEFSDGYDAHTPVERVTVGELKRRFGRER